MFSLILTPSYVAGIGQKKSVPREGEIGHKPTWFIKFKKSNNIYDFIILSSEN